MEFRPGNDLELALREAANEPARRPDFYRLLLEAEVFVIGGDGPGPHGRRTLAAGETLSIQSWQRADGTSALPFFSSLSALERAITEPCDTIGLPARSLFEVTRGETLVLNPTLDYGKEFFPNEIDALLAGGLTRLPEGRVVQKATRVLFGQPQAPPLGMMEALRAFLSTRSQVAAAYVALMHDPGIDEHPHLLVGIQVDGDGEHERLFREIGSVAADTAPTGDAIDMCRVVPGEAGASAYFLGSVEPFYKRSMGMT